MKRKINSSIEIDEKELEHKKASSKHALSLLKQPTAVLGTIRVAKYYPGKPQVKLTGYKNILIHTSGRPLGGDLSPYILRNEQGQLLENVWQFSKLYANVTAQQIPLSRWNPNLIIWKHDAETHVDKDGNPTNAYWQWRKKGMNHDYAVRYPNGYHGRHRCVCSLFGNKEHFERLDYIEARKQIYCAEYIRLAPKTPHFKQLLALLKQGVNLQILEVDGPDPTLTYPPYNQLSMETPGLIINETVIRMLVNDARKPFGHGYVIASLLLGGIKWMTD